MAILITLIKFILIISFLVLIHEGGHFLTAKAVGMQVDEFSIGFGPQIFSFNKNGTKYTVRWIPLGGYVSLDGESGESENPNAFANKPAWAKMLVIVMGSLVNIVFALITIFVMVMYQGTHYDQATGSNVLTTTVAELTGNSAGERAGIQVGDKILKIDGKKVRVRNDITQYLSKSKEQEVTVTVLRNGKEIDIKLIPNVVKYGYTGMVFKEVKDETDTNIVESVADKSVGQIAGLIEGDRIVKIDDDIINNNPDLLKKLDANKGKTVRFEIIRQENNVELLMTVPNDAKIGVDFVKTTYTNEIGEVQVDSPALNAGLQKGDRVIAINNTDTTYAEDISFIAYIHPDEALPIKVLRDGVEKNLTITPICPELLVKYEIGFIGEKAEGIRELVYTGFWQSMYEVRSMIDQIISIFTGQISTKYLSGPVGIAKVIDQVSGFESLLTLVVLISLNLGIINLLPIPPLDGGKLLFLIIEVITRKPVNEKVEYAFQMAGFMLFIGLTLYVTFNDITRNLSIF